MQVFQRRPKTLADPETGRSALQWHAMLPNCWGGCGAACVVQLPVLLRHGVDDRSIAVKNQCFGLDGQQFRHDGRHASTRVDEVDVYFVNDLPSRWSNHFNTVEVFTIH